MLQHFHLTRRQWFAILRWAVYALLFLLALVVQSVVVSRLRPFGCKLSTIPLLLVVICLREGPERGGLFVVLSSLVWALSGLDLGSVQMLSVTVCAVLFAHLSRTVLAERSLTALVLCFAATLLAESLVFSYKLLIGMTAISSWLHLVLPGAALSMLPFWPVYLLVGAIHRIGGDHGV